jgi:hypothetical protein
MLYLGALPVTWVVVTPGRQKVGASTPPLPTTRDLRKDPERMSQVGWRDARPRPDETPSSM